MSGKYFCLRFSVLLWFGILGRKKQHVICVIIILSKDVKIRY